LGDKLEVPAVRGIALVEVLIAVVVLSVGVLAAASGATLIARLTAQGRWAAGAAAIAAGRLETLRSQDCTGLAGGKALNDRYQVTWTVTTTRNGRGRDVLVTLAWLAGRGVRTETFAGTMPCGTGADTP
jgi:Tfp pilus assembly protein PilV